VSANPALWGAVWQAVRVGVRVYRRLRGGGVDTNHGEMEDMEIEDARYKQIVADREQITRLTEENAALTRKVYDLHDAVEQLMATNGGLQEKVDRLAEVNLSLWRNGPPVSGGTTGTFSFHGDEEPVIVGNQGDLDDLFGPEEGGEAVRYIEKRSVLEYDIDQIPDVLRELFEEGVRDGMAAPESVSGEDAAPDMVNHPPHYTQGGVECIDAIRAALGEDGFRAYCRGNALKYLWRAGLKGDEAEDLAKAAWYARKAAGVQE
jgi:hypothetical protein